MDARSPKLLDLRPQRSPRPADGAARQRRADQGAGREDSTLLRAILSARGEGIRNDRVMKSRNENAVRRTGERTASGFRIRKGRTGWPAPACFVLAMCFPALHSGAAERPPNILFILGDNLGQEWLGCYGSEEGPNTPNIDSLAKRGVRFEHCYATPYCSTARVMLMTGRYPFRTGWVTHHDAGKYGGGNFDWNRETTFVRLLRDAGYATAIAGKWQLNLFSEQPGALDRHGFDEHCTWPDGLEQEPGRGRNYRDTYIEQNGNVVDTKGRFGPDVFADFSIDFMRRHRDEPFFVFHSTMLCHTPPVTTPHSPDENAEPRAMFAGMVRYLDTVTGRLTGALAEMGLSEETIVIFSTDNGTNSALVGRINGRQVQGGVGTLWERGLDVPFIVNWPGRIRGGRVIGNLIDYTDVLPTLVELAGAKLPEDRVIDGRSFAKTLLGEPGGPEPREWIHSQYHRTRVIRDERFKLYSTGHFYDLDNDWFEESDLQKNDEAKIAAVRKRLQAVLDSFPPDAELRFEPQSQNARSLRERERSGRAGRAFPQLP